MSVESLAPPPHVPAPVAAVSRPLTDIKRNEEDPLSAADIPYLIESGLYKLAPAQPLVTKLFPVQPIPRGPNTSTIVYALDKSKLKTRKWNQGTREMRSIGGGKWKVKTWSGGTPFYSLVVFRKAHLDILRPRKRVQRRTTGSCSSPSRTRHPRKQPSSELG